MGLRLLTASLTRTEFEYIIGMERMRGRKCIFVREG